MARPRNSKHRAFPENLYERNGYYSWRDPRDGKEYGIGRDKREAFDQSIEANLHISGPQTSLRVVDRLNGMSNDKTFGDWCDRYKTLLEETRELRATSLNSVRAYLVVARKKWDNWPISSITTLDIADLLKEWTDAGKNRMATHVRSRLVDLFREAQAAGWIQQNPAEITKVRGVKVKRERLTLEQFELIYTKAKEERARPWIARMIELALLTGQRREDLANMKFTDVRDNHLFVQQIKTGQKVALSLELSLPDLPGATLGSVIESCRKGSYTAKTLLYHTRNSGKAKHGDPLYISILSNGFAIAREKAEIMGENPPTLHEIRSLSGRLYEKQYGKDFSQAIWGHRNANTSAIYLDVRGSEWVNIAPPSGL
ncbi:MAG: phage integrase Arm DNA-binding domain-containing protein [Formivibrio sp.]|nr:phage integrase Arm DNA-binding domain-containing protein [Formivibrio sp.]